MPLKIPKGRNPERRRIMAHAQTNRRFGQRLINRLSTSSLTVLEGFLEDYDYLRGDSRPWRKTEATWVERGLRIARQRRGDM